jgi:hypothetical protein
VARGVGGLRTAAEAAVAAWEGGTDRALAMEGLKAALAPATKAPRTPRSGTKNEAVLTLLRREDGASIAQIIEATGWAPHTVRGYLVGLKKRGISVEVMERVRQFVTVARFVVTFSRRSQCAPPNPTTCSVCAAPFSVSRMRCRSGPYSQRSSRPPAPPDGPARAMPPRGGQARGRAP